MDKILNKVIRVADKGYPDGFLKKYWNFKNSVAQADLVHGDGLATFIVSELHDVCGGITSYEVALTEATMAIDTAIDQLIDVRSALAEEFRNNSKLGKR